MVKTNLRLHKNSGTISDEGRAQRHGEGTKAPCLKSQDDFIIFNVGNAAG